VNFTQDQLDVAAHEVKIPQDARAKIVEYTDSVSARHQGLDQVRTDKAGPSCD
jgi:hypothetical protein